MTISIGIITVLALSTVVLFGLSLVVLLHWAYKPLHQPIKAAAIHNAVTWEL